MAFSKQADAKLIDPVLSLQDWGKMYGTSTFGKKTASTRKVAEDQSKYLLSHCTIMTSVMGEDRPFGYLIKPECSHLFNQNDDAWTNQVLKKSHRSFVGAFNFVEHYQNSKHAKGHILDSILRKVNITPEVWVYFCDILVATDLAHEQLINDIKTEKYDSMSMGCTTNEIQCSFCGVRVTDQNNYCTHLQFQKGTILLDEDGVPRRIGELCGNEDLANGGVSFCEASWVKNPAALSAKKRNIVMEEWIGPKTRFTQKASSLQGLQKAASAEQNPDLSDFLLSHD